jgi:HD-GYP domain-containing protein (c-di-GMP phosphodiesterase class II)
LAIEVGKRMGFTGKELADLEYGAIFHDLGKLAMPDSILRGNRPELAPEEWAIIHTHTIVGEQIIAPIGFLRAASKIVRHSHEYWDGGGYPDGLAGEDIPLASRVILACDAYDAMVSGRTYQDAMSHDAAIARLRELSGSHFDPAVVEVLLVHVAESVQKV